MNVSQYCQFLQDEDDRTQIEAKVLSYVPIANEAPREAVAGDLVGDGPGRLHRPHLVQHHIPAGEEDAVEDDTRNPYFNNTQTKHLEKQASEAGGLLSTCSRHSKARTRIHNPLPVQVRKGPGATVRVALNQLADRVPNGHDHSATDEV
jgi:hypothetical protein